MSQVWPVWPPDSPLVPRGWTASSSHLALSLSTDSAVHPGRSSWTEALMPVPRLVGQEWMYPYCSEQELSLPVSALTASPTALMPRARRAKTPLTSPPFSIEMMRDWSSSLTHMRKVLASLWKIHGPRASHAPYQRQSGYGLRRRRGSGHPQAAV